MTVLLLGYIICNTALNLLYFPELEHSGYVTVALKCGHAIIMPVFVAVLLYKSALLAAR